MAPMTPQRGPIRVLTTGGLIHLQGLDDTEASEVGRHWNAVRAYLDFGDDRPLEEFDGVVVGGLELETDPDVIEWHAVRGDVSFESIYNEVI